MSVAAIRCPVCGAEKVKNIGRENYQCTYCGGTFMVTQPNVHKTDVVSHNCPECGKPVSSGTGYVCVKCGRGDLCNECTDKMSNGYWCKACIKELGRACFTCGKLATHYCGSCKGRASKGLIQADEMVVQTCDDDYQLCFTTFHREERRGQPPLWGRVSFTCPNCGEICCECAETKKGLFSSEYRCKNCNTKVSVTYIEESAL